MPCRPPPSPSSRSAASRPIFSRASARTRTSSPRHRRFRRPGHSISDEGHRQTSRARGAAEGDRPRGNWRRQCRCSGRHRERHYRDEYAVWQFDHHRRHAIALMFALARQIPQADLSTRPANGKRTALWVSRSPARCSASSAAALSGRSSPRARLACRCGSSPTILSSRPNAPSISASRKSALKHLLARADFITLHTPLTAQTKNILSAENLAKTKKGVRIVNCARGGLADERALRALLDSGHVAGAAFDVFGHEPATEIRFSAIQMRSARRILALRPARRKKTSRYRSPRRCRII